MSERAFSLLHPGVQKAIWITYQLPSLEGFVTHLRHVIASEPDAVSLARLMPVKAIEKYDDFVPEPLLDEANARSRLDIREACAACAGVLV